MADNYNIQFQRLVHREVRRFFNILATIKVAKVKVATDRGDGFTPPRPFHNERQRLPAQPLEACAEVRGKIRTNTRAHGALESHLLNVTEIGEYKSKPETQQGILENVANLLRVGLFFRQGQPATDVSKAH